MGRMGCSSDPFSYSEGDIMKNMVICGLGYISNRVAHGCMLAKSMNLYGVQSRSIDKARSTAERLGAERAYGSFEEVLGDPAVDLVYLCTPNGTHAHMAEQALKAGKAVVSEKPLASNTEEVSRLFAIARETGCLLMEAEKTAFSPLVAKLREIIASGAIGELTSIEATYAYDRLAEGTDPSHWIYGEAGGCALDIGVYPACFANAIAGSSINKVDVVRDYLAPYTVDFGVRAHALYESGVIASIASSWCYDLPGKGGAYIHGTKGFIEVPAYWKSSKAIVHTAWETYAVCVEMASDFEPEIEAAARALEQGLCEVPGMGERETCAIYQLFGV